MSPWHAVPTATSSLNRIWFTISARKTQFLLIPGSLKRAIDQTVSTYTKKPGHLVSMLLAMEKHIMIAHGFCWQFQSDLWHSLVPTCANNESSPKAMLVMWRCARCSFAACAAQNVPAWPDVTCDTWGSIILQPAVAQPRGGASWLTCYESAGFVSPRRQSWPSSTGNCEPPIALGIYNEYQWIAPLPYQTGGNVVKTVRRCTFLDPSWAFTIFMSPFFFWCLRFRRKK